MDLYGTEKPQNHSRNAPRTDRRMTPLLLCACIASSLSIAVLSDATIKPNPFPPSATWTAHLLTTNNSELCAACTFKGVHSINTKENKLHVRWEYGPTNDTTRSTYTNFADIVLGDQQTMYQVRGDNNAKASCINISPFPMSNFNASWSNDAVYEGDYWFKGRLCRKFTNVYPYVVQAKNVPSTYYEHIFSGLPAGYENELELMWYDPDDFDLTEPKDAVFDNVLLMNCTAPRGGGAARESGRYE